MIGSQPARVLAALALAVVLAMSIAGCGSGKLGSEADAIAQARFISGLADPITILKVAHGPAGEIFDGVPPSGPGEAAAEKGRLRPAWMVKMQGFAKAPCADAPAPLPCGLLTIEVVMAEDTGDVIESYTGPG